MHAVAGSLVKRGLEIHQNGEYKLPVWGVVILVLTGLAFFFMDASIEYTFGRLIPTLIMVETPQAVLLESASDSKDVGAPLVLDSKYKDDVKAPASPLISADSEMTVLRAKPITTTFRSTLRHLRSVAGCCARYRGLLSFIVYSTSLRFVTHGLMVLPFVPRVLAPVLAAMLTANLAMTWTHIAISMPSSKSWYQRIPRASQWKKVLGPSAALAAAKEACCWVPFTLATHWGVFSYSHEELQTLSGQEMHILAWKAGVLGMLALVMVIVLVIPANVTLTRMQASMLETEQDTIVPFDRSFDGKVVPEILGGSGVVEAREAWKSFDLTSRATLFKAYGKVVLFEVFWSLIFGVALMAELVLIMGDDIKKFIPKDSPLSGQ